MTTLDEKIRAILDPVPKNCLPIWVTESHDVARVSTKHGEDAVDALHMLTILLPGSVNVYYGSEMGLENSMVRKDQAKDTTQDGVRDQYRGSMPWDGTKNGGFTTCEKPSLPLHPNYWRKNVQSQTIEPQSHLNIFKRLVTLKKTPLGMYGDLETHVVNEWTYAFTRSLNNETMAVVINLGSDWESICVSSSNFGSLPEVMYVHTGSANSGFKIGEKLRIVKSEDHHCAELRPKAGVVLTTFPSRASVWCTTPWLLLFAIGFNFL